MARCKLFATIKIVVVLLLTDLTSSTKISDLTKNDFSQLNVSNSVVLLTDLTSSNKISDLTKTTFYN